MCVSVIWLSGVSRLRDVDSPCRQPVPAAPPSVRSNATGPGAREGMSWDQGPGAREGMSWDHGRGGREGMSWDQGSGAREGIYELGRGPRSQGRHEQ